MVRDLKRVFYFGFDRSTRNALYSMRGASCARRSPGR